MHIASQPGTRYQFSKSEQFKVNYVGVSFSPLQHLISIYYLKCWPVFYLRYISDPWSPTISLWPNFKLSWRVLQLTKNSVWIVLLSFNFILYTSSVNFTLDDIWYMRKQCKNHIMRSFQLIQWINGYRVLCYVAVSKPSSEK